MKELWLTFTNEHGETEKISVDREMFEIGRHSECDLSISDSRLSRRHTMIEKIGDDFYVSDLNSSNGTTLNYQPVFEPTLLKNGDAFDTGGGVRFSVEIVESAAENPFDKEVSAENPADETAPAQENDFVSQTAAANAPANTQSVSASSGGTSFSTIAFIAAPVLGLIVLIFAAGLIIIFSGNGEKETAKTDDIYVVSDDDDDDGFSGTKKDVEPEADTSPVVSETETSPNDSSNENSADANETTETVNNPPVQETSGDAQKIEQNAGLFLKSISRNDSKAFLTSKQVGVVQTEINKLKGSANLAANFKEVRENAAQIKSLADSKNMKPEFLAAAALAKIGNSRGNVMATAQSMLENLANMSGFLGYELANDNLLVIAAYDQGAAGKERAMRDTLGGLTKKFPHVHPTSIRTIWFLRENGKLTDAEFDFAIRFLAVGTVMQNPKEFSVNAEAVKF